MSRRILLLPEVHRYPPSMGNVVTGSIRPRWWVRAMSATAHTLWKCHLPTASWALADLCTWLQSKTQKRRRS